MAKVGRLVKDLVLQELATALQERPSFFVTAVGSLPAVEADALRKRLAGAQARVLMVKRTLGLRGVSSLGLDGKLFDGSVAFVFPGEDIVPAAKLLVDFAKASQDKMSVRGGWVEGQALSAKHVEELSNLPPRPQLMAQVVGALESPAAGLIFTLEQLIGDIAWIVEEAGKKQPQPSAS